ncbi:predicted protein [Postia placenta Mad-698-R]|uniref:Uncharacterized protein n=1 Tax=Postia placenta MAD-698-R-SB12 TaxID=670580 RepID=A0A1X6N1Y1_9APHY|nr:hypothetical protein POSPLADRAFT_1046064 [Postia placenta MAD-698-R-SB12]EED82445.1 predicted protein [Postia placenta Mad-698-R]OSX62625.1 hypothetical protein POSPLADRAFT_1046064 [Postia placenta MAD-698-R-SB12]
MSAPSAPSVIDLTSAKHVQLQHWIDAINQNTGKKLIALSGKVDKLWECMARHYGLNLAQAIEPASPASSPHPINEEIQCRQWAHLRDLADEWREKAARAPLLVSPGLSTPMAAASLASLPSTPSHQAKMTFDTVRSWVEAAQAGNPYAIAGLSVAQWLLVPDGTSVAGPSSLLVNTVSMSNQVPTANATTSLIEATSEELLTPSSVQENDRAILDACQKDFAALEHVTGIHDVIAQVENGSVARLRTQYGGTWAWETIKVGICRRECLYGELQDAFGGDKDHFYAFFAEPPDLRKRRKQDSLHAYRLVVEAIPHCKKDIAHEQLKPEYQDVFSTFSEQCWCERWKSMNDWEIWRELGLEWYR